jgi:Holliday junction DNA helicase RuvA
MGLGHNPVEARERLDRLLQSGQSFRSVEEAITVIYARGEAK